jgi:hypothetical protein
MIRDMTTNWQIDHPPATTAREVRTSKLLSVEISCARFGRKRVVVRNLSFYGIGARGEIDLLPTEHVTVHLPGGRDIEAIVRWVRKGTFGLSLEERINPADLQTRNAVDRPLTTRDATIGFQRYEVPPTQTQRTGFQRSHRDEVLSSSWRD